MRKTMKSLTLSKLSIIAFFLGSLLLPGCEDLFSGCVGCGSLTPWSVVVTRHAIQMRLLANVIPDKIAINASS